ncbi:hypothetical protein NJF44_25310 [Pseudomonas guariconensis]|uniref:hypothetical protein n=1 Tax=Pseudomonas TaxID=286 RepID=UPI002097EB6D|nr:MULTISPECIES: hypothetical protein [Pseudomonas]MCO7643779.1 hypothetical protein [Pseudomonas sp. S 311-6]MCO7518048.1 hypothetical protein [Pseudomonas putida]MCO7568303.1 hypothetical protein [Pseudomonas mosselii]MCO7608550.1 hypothetical protein [Pseudomonas guariconensis]MCO7619988.1 hypothetical protein [Pseudomonas guariconensis]
MKVTLFISAVIGMLVYLAGCQNIAFNPKPSQELFRAALSESQDVVGDNGESLERVDIEAVLTGKFDEKTPVFSLSSIKPDGSMITLGFQRNMASFGFRSIERYTEYGIPYKPIKGFTYSYSARVSGLEFSNPSRTENSNSRTMLILHTKPESAYRLIIYYQDNTTATVDLVSYATSRRLGGGYKSTRRSYFDGKLWMTPASTGPGNGSLSGGGYRINGPYGS